jgi:(2Fe-2S) ferredoxin
MQQPDHEKLERIAAELRIGEFSRHIFLCVGESCCTKQSGEEAWKMLKGRLKELNLSMSSGPSACYRSKVNCLRVCTGGPILVVYPEGYWYSGMTVDRIERFIEQQLVRGEPIDEWIFARNPLPNLAGHDKISQPSED